MLLNCDIGEDSWESLGLQGDPTVHFKGDQRWVFFGRNDAKAEAPVFWPPHVKSWLIGKDCDAGRDWGQEKDRGWDGWMASRTRWMWVWVNSGRWWWTGRLGCCDSWGRKESDTTERLNWTGYIYLCDVCIPHKLRGKKPYWLLFLHVNIKKTFHFYGLKI